MTHLLDLPSLSDADLGSLKEVEYVKPLFIASLNATESLNTTTVSATVESWTRVSDSRLVLQLSDEATMLLDAGDVLVLERPVAVVFFDAQGVGNFAGMADAPEDIDVEDAVAEVQAVCIAQGCPLSSCTGALAVQPLLVEVKHVECSGVRVWSWPDGVSLADEPDDEEDSNATIPSRRALQGGAQICESSCPKNREYWQALECPYCKQMIPQGRWPSIPRCVPFSSSGRGQGQYADWHSCSECCEYENEYYEFKASFKTNSLVINAINKYYLDWPGICKPSVTRRQRRRNGGSRYPHLSTREARGCQRFTRNLNRKKGKYQNCVRTEYYAKGGIIDLGPGL